MVMNQDITIEKGICMIMDINQDMDKIQEIIEDMIIMMEFMMIAVMIINIITINIETITDRIGMDHHHQFITMETIKDFLHVLKTIRNGIMKPAIDSLNAFIEVAK